ncbi:hypothetical protein CBW58_02105 [Yersinia frederiksenii]|nr:hypothetical protein CBW58_02105 [Yersinia frederiksenii]
MRNAPRQDKSPVKGLIHAVVHPERAVQPGEGRMMVLNPGTGKRMLLWELKPMGKPGVCPKHCNGWTEQEDRVLLELWNSMSAAAIAEYLPGRNEKAVYDRVQRMRKTGIATPTIKQVHFTEEEDRFIRRNCATMTTKEIGRHLNRTPGVIMGRGHAIGVRFIKYGEASHLARISDHDVRLIRALRDEYNLGFSEIAKKFEISRQEANRIYHKRLTVEDRLREDMLPGNQPSQRWRVRAKLKAKQKGGAA